MDAPVVRQGSGEMLRIGPTTTVIKVPGAAVRNRFGVVQMHLPAGFAGPPAHVHAEVDHLWVVQEGVVDLVVDGRVERVGAGDLAVARRGLPHTFSTLGSGPAVVLEVDIGTALDGYFRGLRDALGSGAVDPAAVEAVMARHDTSVVRS